MGPHSKLDRHLLPKQGQQHASMNKATWDSLAPEDKKTWDAMSDNGKHTIITYVRDRTARVMGSSREPQDTGVDAITQEANKTITTPVVTPSKKLVVNKHTQGSTIHPDTSFMAAAQSTPVRTLNLKGTCANIALMLSPKPHPITVATLETTDNGIGTCSRVTHQASVHDQRKGKKKPAPKHVSLIDRHHKSTHAVEEGEM